MVSPLCTARIADTVVWKSGSFATGGRTASLLLASNSGYAGNDVEKKCGGENQYEVCDRHHGPAPQSLSLAGATLSSMISASIHKDPSLI